MSANKSVFTLYDKKTGSEIELTLLGFTNIESQVFVVCSPRDDEDGRVTGVSKAVIFRLKYDSKKRPLFTLVDDAGLCRRVFEAFTEDEMKGGK